MAKRKRRTTVRSTKAKAAKRRAKVAKKSVKRATGKKPRKTAKKVALKTSRKRVSRSKRVSPSRQAPRPSLETTVIDVVDEPIPGVVRVTEIEETRGVSADQDSPESSRDVPEPDSLGG